MDKIGLLAKLLRLNEDNGIFYESRDKQYYVQVVIGDKAVTFVDENLEPALDKALRALALS